MKRHRSLFDFIVRSGPPDNRKSIPGLPLSRPVKVKQDRYGIPHIYAENEQDLMTAQGFIHARDRLWQMETIRRLVNGTLSEIAGDSTYDLDCFTRLAGFTVLHKRQLAALDTGEQALFQAYANGINAFIDYSRPKFPLEFRKAGFEPALWTINDIGSSLILNSWTLQTNYLEEILAILIRDRVDEQQWNELFGVYSGAEYKPENFFRGYAHRSIGPVLPAALAFYRSLAIFSGGSNNWVIADGPKGLPLLANDPHLKNGIPQVWHFCHLHCPTINVCGAALPSTPGIIIGRNEHVAWGLTNVMTDCCDLFIVDIDPERRLRYRHGDTYLDMESESVHIPIKNSESRKFLFYRTVHGPIITSLSPGVETAAALTWHGTFQPDWSSGASRSTSSSKQRETEETTLKALFKINRARSVEECIKAGQLLKSIGQNIVVADRDGTIGWYACGRIPVRKGYSGRLPADGSSGECGWIGFVDPADNPSLVNPQEGRIVTANHKTVDERYPYTISHSWIPPYRYEQITALLKTTQAHSIESFSLIQNDLFSKRAEQYLPVILSFSYQDPAAQEAAKLLKQWDCSMDAGTTAGMVFQVFLLQFAEELLSGLLRIYLPLYLMQMIIIYSVLDRFFDRSFTKNDPSSLLGSRKLENVCEQGLTRTIRYIEHTLGKNRKKWKWGTLHRYLYKHAGAKNPVASWLLNRGPYPAGGSNDTVNVAHGNLARTGEALKQFEVTVIPSMRFITSLADEDSSVIIGPMGQSGRPGFPHYADMIEPWMKGRTTSLPLSKKAVEAITVSEILLQSHGVDGIISDEEK